MANNFTVEHTQSTVYLNRSGTAIQGYLVIVNLPEFDEVHELRVPDLKPETVKRAAEELYQQRKALAGL
jgi:hypothetical protein